MRTLIINRIKYTVLTESKKKYGADVKFTTGLNIIYGPNSVGKSSLVTGIIYCLGAEKALGIFQNKQNPFKPEFYDIIHGEKIATSYVQLEISNGHKTITLIRSIINKTNVVGIKETTIEGFHEINTDGTDKYKTVYLIASGDGVFSENGLQNYLFNFLGWDIVNIPTYDNTESKLYIENIISLFFVEQRVGWSQIQARQVMRYGIRDVKKVAFEYLMGLDKFNIHLKEIERKEVLEKIYKAKRELKEKEENLVVIVNGKVDGEVLLVDKVGYGRGSIYDILQLLERAYNERSQEIENLTTSSDSLNGSEDNLRSTLRITNHLIKKESEKVFTISQEIASYESYLERININKQKNKQLKRIEGLTIELNLSICPVCENPLPEHEDGDCKLCHQELKRRISTPDENLEFLEDEKTSFEKILDIKRIELRKAKYKLQELKEKEKSITENIDHQLKTYVGPQLDALRKKINELDIINREIALFKRVIDRWEKLSKLKDEISSLEKEDEKLKKLISAYKQSTNDTSIINTLLSFFKSDVSELRLLKSKEELITKLDLDESEYYTPYLDQYDLYNISSSSDNVRIILSYYLSMLQTSISLSQNSNIRFPNILILDEPKQQNLDDRDINTFIEILEKQPKDSCQIILTTFNEQERNKELFQKFIRHEMEHEFDYLLKEIS